MKSHPESAEVLSDLGEKVTEAFARAVSRARLDLANYRENDPGWVAQSSERGLANWIHDRLWHHLISLVDGLPDIQIVDTEPMREVFAGVRYRLRAKRHADDGSISTYATAGAMDFLVQPPTQETLAGLEEIRLIVGYIWDKESREIGPSVLSLRDGKDAIVWVEELPDPGTGYGGGTVTPIPTAPEPTAPVIDVGDEAAQDSEESAES
ncbi:hypothetical protein ACIBEJ_35220 [Nonomuraea sp. NPDC050790]|uniref:hypothetical protein n=1 Tax=Nonomuraea sp. NPDC050790 TaxID=3364371 RepID=UPI0037A3784F